MFGPSATMAMAAKTNGYASPSFRPASLVRENLTSSSRSTLSPSTVGSPTWTSAASTGSVGATTAPNSSAVAGARPAAQPARNIAPIVIGIVTPSRRHALAHDRQPGTRSRDRPAPSNEIRTASSVTCSVTSRCCRGSTSPSPGTMPKVTAPMAISTIGSDSGRSRRYTGSHAARSTTMPTKTALSV